MLTSMNGLACVLLVLGACSAQKPPPPICPVPPLQDVDQSKYKTATAGDWGSEADACIDHWAAILASSPDSPNVITEAVVGHCDVGLIAEADATVSNPKVIPHDPDEMRKRMEDFARARALFDIEERRASGCAKAGDY
jgi:hypothetical protein